MLHHDRHREPHEHGAHANQEARELVRQGAVLVDVRSRKEYARDRLPGAVNIPLSELRSHPERLGEAGERPVVLYCRTGERSAAAAAYLRRLGWDARNGGSIRSW